MAKPQPPLEPEQFYHVFNHANGNDNIFRADKNYHFFLRLYSTHISGIVNTLAYCLMPNHFHFVIHIKSETELRNFYSKKKKPETLEASGTLQGLYKLNSQQFSNLFNSYAQAFNKVYSRRGGLFISNFKRRKVTSNEYLLNLIQYVHDNPVHHGFVEMTEDWKYSSYHALFSKKKTMLARSETLDLFGGTAECREFHQKEINKEFLISEGGTLEAFESN
jgi:putative transposase